MKTSKLVKKKISCAEKQGIVKCNAGVSRVVIQTMAQFGVGRVSDVVKSVEKTKNWKMGKKALVRYLINTGAKIDRTGEYFCYPQCMNSKIFSHFHNLASIDKEFSVDFVVQKMFEASLSDPAFLHFAIVPENFPRAVLAWFLREALGATIRNEMVVNFGEMCQIATLPKVPRLAIPYLLKRHGVAPLIDMTAYLIKNGVARNTARSFHLNNSYLSKFGNNTVALAGTNPKKDQIRYHLKKRGINPLPACASGINRRTKYRDDDTKFESSFGVKDIYKTTQAVPIGKYIREECKFGTYTNGDVSIRLAHDGNNYSSIYGLQESLEPFAVGEVARIRFDSEKRTFTISKDNVESLISIQDDKKRYCEICLKSLSRSVAYTTCLRGKIPKTHRRCRKNGRKFEREMTYLVWVPGEEKLKGGHSWWVPQRRNSLETTMLDFVFLLLVPTEDLWEQELFSYLTMIRKGERNHIDTEIFAYDDRARGIIDKWATETQIHKDLYRFN